MKNRGIFALLISGMLAFTACAGGYVSEQPANVIYERPAAPGAGYIWIDGDWVWGGGRYTWRAGRWDRPRTGRVWHAGSWQHTSRGHHWQRGHW